MLKIANQADLHAAIAAGATEVELVGDVEVSVTGTTSITMCTSGSSQPRVVAYDSSQPRVVAYGSSQPRVVAYGSSQISTEGHVAIDVKSAAVTIATDTSSHVTGTAAHIVVRTKPTNAEAWCQHWGVPVVDGVATLYKAVRDDYRSEHRCDYRPGSIPVAGDWDGGVAECGGGLHFSPRPVIALGFDREATRFLACPVALADMRAPKTTDSYPHKVKARACCGPVVEVDIDGEPLAVAAVVAGGEV